MFQVSYVGVPLVIWIEFEMEMMFKASHYPKSATTYRDLKKRARSVIKPACFFVVVFFFSNRCLFLLLFYTSYFPWYVICCLKVNSPHKTARCFHDSCRNGHQRLAKSLAQLLDCERVILLLIAITFKSRIW